MTVEPVGQRLHRAIVWHNSEPVGEGRDGNRAFDGTRRPARLAAGLALALFVAYNANGREIGTVDSQPQKYVARELAVTGTLTLTRVIEERPGLGERVAFARDRHGDWRSAYPILPGVLAAVPAALLHWTGVVDMDAPLAPNLVAKLTASAMTTGAVVLMFLTLLRVVPERTAWWTAIGLGVGTGYWPVLAQTLWQHGPAALGLSLCLHGWLRADSSLNRRALWTGGLGLGLAGAARPALVPAVVVLLLWVIRRAGPGRAVAALVPVAVLAALSIVTNVYWFGDPLGAYRLVEAVHPTVHGVPHVVAEQPWTNAAGLLVSPSRGLLLYSPVVLVVFAGLRSAWRAGDVGVRWLLAAACIQFSAYAWYSVWWGGHSFGPRYLLDLLPLVVPAAALGVERLRQSRLLLGLGVLLLGASVAVAAAGAFVYPHDRWNTSPADVDRNHHRLWDWHDTQLLRVFQTPPSPQNFNLLSREAIRQGAQ